MTIGEKIKSLRRDADITQEKLAKYLHVSYQAISKWENNTAKPDISFIVPLANFFGVTTDELFDIDGRDSQKDLEEYNKKRFDLMHEGKVREALALCREVNAKYPKNYEWLEHLASILLTVTNSYGFSKEECALALPEALSICECILEDCTNDEIRASCRQTLVYLYDKNGEPDKALSEAKKAPSIYLSRELLCELAWNSNEETDKTHCQNILMYTYLLTAAISRYDKNETDEIRIKRYETAISIWKLVVDDENYLFHHWQIGHLYKMAAISYARLSMREKMYECLKKAFYHNEKHDSLPESKTYYTGTFIRHCCFDPAKTTQNYTGSNVELLKSDVLSQSAFAPYLKEPEFKVIFE